MAQLSLMKATLVVAAAVIGLPLAAQSAVQRTAFRLGDGAEILDEYRVVGASGETYYVRTRCAPTTQSSTVGSSSRQKGAQGCRM